MRCAGYAYALITIFTISSPEVNATDFETKITRINWYWSDERADLRDSIKRAGKNKVTLQFEGRDKDHMRITVETESGKPWSWTGNWGSQFSVVEGRLYYAYAANVPSGWVVCVDLERGEELWRTHLQALSVYEVSNYQSQIILDVTPDAIYVWGNETLGKYLELLDPVDGKLLANRVYKSSRGPK